MTHTGSGLMAVLMAVSATPAVAATYYVSPTGTSEWTACTNIATPCSWQMAMAYADDDDVVYFRSGTYDVESNCSGTWEYIAMAPTNSGSPGHPITFAAYPGETPVVNGCTSIESPAFGARDVDYIIWDGFASGTIHDADRENWFFLYWNSNHSIVRNCAFSGIDSALGDGHRNSAPIRVEVSHDVEIHDNDLRCSGGQIINSACVYLFATIRTRIHHNIMHSGDYGVMQKLDGNTDNEIHHNFFHSLAWSGVVLIESASPGSGHMVHHNVLADMGDAAIVVLPTLPEALQQSYRIYNNTIHSARSGISLSDSSRDIEVWNNIIHSAGRPALRYFTGAALPAYSDHNLFYPVGGGEYWDLDWATYYTSLAEWQAATGYDSASRAADPELLNAGGLNVYDYRRLSYPTDGRGGSYASVMGAFETGTESIGCRTCSSPGVVRPSRPSNLRVF